MSEIAEVLAVEGVGPLLTIVVPTFNRAASLEFLLEALMDECVPLGRQVQVLVSDNASTDDTKKVICRMLAKWPALATRRHDTNVGPEENFCSALDIVQTRYFWIVGDDDCPRAGLIGGLLKLLGSVSPAIVYMESEWMNPLTSAAQKQKVHDLRVEVMDLDAFVSRINVWFTFISACVIDRTVMQREIGAHTIRRFMGTSLVQLGWVYPVVRSGKGLTYIREKCVLATRDNTGGYKLLTVFGVNLSRITHDVFGRNSHATRLIISRTVMRCLPGLVWGARRSRHVRHLHENPWQEMRHELGGYCGFWLILLPLGKFPEWLAFPIFQLWRLGNRAAAELRKFRERRIVTRHRGGVGDRREVT